MSSLRPGDRVRLRPSRTADIMDLVLAGRVAIIEAIEEDFEGRVHLAVTVEDDPGRDLGVRGLPGHRFYFRPDEVERLVGGPTVREGASHAPGPSEKPSLTVGPPKGLSDPATLHSHRISSGSVRMSRLLIAGVGNVFLGDDAFGVEVVRRLVGRFDPGKVQVVDFGTRGFDLALALTAGYAGAILIDAVRRGEPPGTLYVIEPDVPPAGEVEGHGLDPAKVLALARTLGEVCPWLRLVGCEPMTVEEPGLSAPVRAALPEAERLVEGLVREFLVSPTTP